MSRNREFTGKNLQEALNSASTKLRIAEPDLDYKIIEQGRRGLFGVGARDVRILVMPPVEPIPTKVTLEKPAERRPARQSDGKSGRKPERKSGRARGRRGRSGSKRDADGPQSEQSQQSQQGQQPRQGQQGHDGDGPSKREPRRRARRRGRGRGRGRGEGPRTAQSEESQEPHIPVTGEAAEVEKTLQKIIDMVELRLSVRGSARQNGSGVTLELKGQDVKKLMRKDGELLSAFQFLLNRMARRTWPNVGRIRVVGDGRKQQREDDLVELTREVAQQVAQTGQAKQLHPMNAYERRVVHMTAREFDQIGSTSEGDGAMKVIRIFKRDAESESESETEA